MGHNSFQYIFQQSVQDAQYLRYEASTAQEENEDDEAIASDIEEQSDKE